MTPLRGKLLTPRRQDGSLTTQSSDATEQVARALYAEAQAEARKVEPNAPTFPTFDEDDEDSRQFCLRMARAAIAAMEG